MERTSCPNCGALTTSVDRFCQNCGIALHAEQPGGPTQAPTPDLPSPPAFQAPAFPAPALGVASSPAAVGYGGGPNPPAVPGTGSGSGRAGDAPAGIQPLLEFDVAYPERLSRLLIFVKWLLILPHLIVLSVVGIALSLVTVVAWFAILVTGRYPRGMWSFAVDTLRWGNNVAAYSNLQRDEYPPFSGTAPYPVHVQLDYPARLSRLLIFVKWLLIIPHLLVVYVLGFVAAIVLFVAWFAILFTGRMPRGIHQFLTGYARWGARVTTYALLLTDAYPPFTLDHVPSPTRTARRDALPY